MKDKSRVFEATGRNEFKKEGEYSFIFLVHILASFVLCCLNSSIMTILKVVITTTSRRFKSIKVGVLVFKLLRSLR